MINYQNVILENYKNIPNDENQYQVDFIQKNNALVLDKTEKRIVVGITENTSEDIIQLLSDYHENNVDFVVIKQSELSSWLGQLLGEKIPNEQEKDLLPQQDDDALILDKIANDAPTVNLVNSICIDALRKKASDIHIESGIENARVRFRIDGVLQTVRKFENKRFSAVSSRIKIMANLNILEKRQPQDGRITVNIGGENIDFRVSIVPASSGESIVMRILGKNNAPESLDKLGFSEKQLDDINKMIKIPHGLILVTGPTGSGKTTTLNAIMRQLVSDEIKIISIEDPVEFIVEGVNQIQINEQINLGFDSILRRVLRQDPNIIMVGEIRDKATAELSIRAALTGHLVLSTIHTNDAVSVIPRLINMGVEPYLISSVLKGAISQRLVRKISDDNLYCGRTVISETMVMDERLEDLINNHASINEIKQYLKNSGMIFIEDDAKDKIRKKVTTLAEVQKEIFL